MAVGALGGQSALRVSRLRATSTRGLVSLALGLALLLLSGTPAYADTATDFMVTDVRDQYAVASWTTTVAEMGSVEIGRAHV